MDDSKGTLANLLKTLRDQNKADLLLQGFQVKYEKEMANEDNDKRESQLDLANKTLEKIEKAITGNNEQIKVLPKNLADKLSVKLSDIKVPEDDKTTLESIKEFVGDTKSFFNKLSGSFGKGFDFVKNPMGAVRGGIEKVKELGTKAQDTFYDIAETKAGYTAEEGRFVEEYKKQNRQFASGMTREEIESGKLTDQGTDLFRQKKDLEEKVKLKQADVDRSKKFGFDPTQEDREELEALQGREKEIFSTKKINQEKQLELDKIDQRLMEKANVGEYGDEETAQLQKKKKETQDQLFESTPKPGEEKLKEVEGKQTKNEEADNVVSAQESMADSFKENTELLKDLLTTTKDQLDLVKTIKDSLAPRDVTDEQNNIQQKKEKFYGDVTTKLEEIYTKLDNLNTGNLTENLLDLLGNRGPKSIPSTATPAASKAVGSPLLAGATLGAVALGGAAATVGATGILATESAAPLRKAVTENPMLGAMSGDTALASGILDANEGKSAEQVRAIQAKEQKALEDAPWYTRMLGVGRSDYLRNKGVLPSVSPTESVTGEKVTTGAAGLPLTKPEVTSSTKAAPKTKSPSQLGNLSLEYNDKTREAAQTKPAPAPLIMNNSSSNNNTSYVPMKSTPRPEYTGSALDRYQSRISTY